MDLFYDQPNCHFFDSQIRMLYIHNHFSSKDGDGYIVFFKQKIYNKYIIYDDDSCICDHILQTMILNMSTAAINGKPGR